MTKKGCSESLRAKFFSRRPWWSANRDKISKCMVRESKKVENRCFNFRRTKLFNGTRRTKRGNYLSQQIV